MQRQDAFDHDECARLNVLGCTLHTSVRAEVIDRAVDGMAFAQFGKLPHDQAVLQRVGMIEVVAAALLWCEM